MNTSIVKSVPQGNFEAVSIKIYDWQKRFQSLVNQRKPIKYDTYDMPTLSKEIQDELAKQNYVTFILESDHSQYFLVPN